MKTIYLVKDLARATGHSVYTVEHYLKEGLLVEYGRSPFTHYRFFDETAVERLKRIRSWKKAGLSLEEIRTRLAGPFFEANSGSPTGELTENPR